MWDRFHSDHWDKTPKGWGLIGVFTTHCLKLGAGLWAPGIVRPPILFCSTGRRHCRQAWIVFSFRSFLFFADNHCRLKQHLNSTTLENSLDVANAYRCEHIRHCGLHHPWAAIWAVWRNEVVVLATAVLTHAFLESVLVLEQPWLHHLSTVVIPQ